MSDFVLSCSDCGKYHCSKRDSSYPDFCLTTNLEPGELEEIKQMYLNAYYGVDETV